MDWPTAQALAGKLYCAACQPDKAVVIRYDPEHRYKVVCPTEEGHLLSMAKSLFTECLAAWSTGQFKGVGMEGLLFTNMLRTMARRNPKWEFKTNKLGQIIRIGRKWAPWYRAK